MSRCSEHHLKLSNGVGKCSVPMWCMGTPAGFCDEPAYGEPPPSRMYRDGSGRLRRMDGRYDGHVPGLACQGHGGPPPRHFGDPCVYCGTMHDNVAPGPCPRTKGDAT